MVGQELRFARHARVAWMFSNCVLTEEATSSKVQSLLVATSSKAPSNTKVLSMK